ncbi:unnamed protein product [Pleuronectes platessa]|uniref:BED-type domain-containing protein n=1 Tax=Pleuronectes platessa TaxID=8262 RepID=A0A9N7YVY9_PLEPL|nr:unnamed protein product [Pleuronectes platessa]
MNNGFRRRRGVGGGKAVKERHTETHTGGEAVVELQKLGLWAEKVSGSTPRRDNKRRTWIDLSKNPRVSLPSLVPLSKAPHSPNICSPSAVHGRSLLCVSCTRWQGVVMSAEWKYFTVNSDKDVAAKCNICQAQVSRGGTEPGRFNTSNLIAHLKKHHKKEHEDFRESSKAKQQASGSLQQPTLAESFARRDKT